MKEAPAGMTCESEGRKTGRLLTSDNAQTGIVVGERDDTRTGLTVRKPILILLTAIGSGVLSLSSFLIVTASGALEFRGWPMAWASRPHIQPLQSGITPEYAFSALPLLADWMSYFAALLFILALRSVRRRLVK